MSQRSIYLFLVVIALGALYLVVGGHGLQEAAKLVETQESVANAERLETCKKFILDRMLDPSAVKWNAHRTEQTGEKTWMEVDFTTLNSFGGPVRKKWAFSFDHTSGWMEWESGPEESMRQYMRTKGLD